MPRLRYTYLLEAHLSSVDHNQNLRGVVFIGNSLFRGALPLMIQNPFFSQLQRRGRV